MGIRVGSRERHQVGRLRDRWKFGLKNKDDPREQDSYENSEIEHQHTG